MRDLNKIVLRGTVSDAPRTKTFDDGSKIVSFSVKTVTKEKDDADYERERSAWHRVSSRGRNAEVAESLGSEDPVYVEGQLETRKYQNQQGQEIWATEVRALVVRKVESAEPQVNRSILLGNVGRKDDIREFDSFKVVNLRIPTSEGWTNRSGEDQEKTEWHSVAAFGTLAEQVDREIAKGQRVLVIGHTHTRKYKSRDGEDRRATETVAQTIIGSGQRTDQPRPYTGQPEPREDRDFENRLRERNREVSGVETDSGEDEVPF